MKGIVAKKVIVMLVYMDQTSLKVFWHVSYYVLESKAIL